MLVTQKNFEEFAHAIVSHKKIGYDTETKGLWWWKSFHNPVVPGVFAAQFAVADRAWYLDFHHSDDKLGAAHWKVLQSQLFSNPEILWYIQNGKFDMHHSANHGVHFAGTIHCTKAIARLVNNLEPQLNLDTLAEKYLGHKKVDIKSEIPRTKIKRWGKNDKFEELAHFDRMPLDRLLGYGLQDTRLAYDLGELQVKLIAEKDEQIRKTFPNLKARTLTSLMEQERELTKVLFEMERTGVQIDIAYATKAYENEVAKYKDLGEQFDAFCTKAIGKTLDIGSPRQLKELFDARGEAYSYTEKGNACFDSDALERSESSIAKLVLRYRYHYKRAHTYFENFIWLADTDGVIHCDFQQSGTETGRMSCWTPNLQNVSKTADKDELEFPVRRCFIPRKGFYFAELDYQAAEYRLMLDYAGEETLIEKVKAGFDVHEATRQELGIETRHEAKTFNFMILYGGGFQKIADALKCTVEQAKTRKQNYFSKLPKVKNFIFTVRDAAQYRGFVVNWSGRVLQYAKDSAFKSPNGLIQGGVGDMGKEAIIRAASLCESRNSRLLLQVHDSLLFEIAKDEDHMPRIFAAKMEAVYPYKKLPMAVSCAYSRKSLADLSDTLQ